MAGAVTLAVGENNANTTFSGSIGGHGTLVKEGTGTLTLTGSNSFTGGLLLDGDGPVKEYADDAMRSGAKAAKKHVDEDRWLRASLALLASDENQVAYLSYRLINAAPDEIDVICRALLPHKERVIEKFWGVARSRRSDQEHLCAACSLARYASDDPRWNAAAAGNVAALLVRVNPLFVKYWADALCGRSGQAHRSLEQHCL